MAGVLETIVGRPGMIFISIGLVISVLGAYLSWSLLAAEVLYSAAKSGLMPKVLAKENANRVPYKAVWLTNIFIQVFNHHAVHRLRLPAGTGVNQLADVNSLFPRQRICFKACVNRGILLRLGNRDKEGADTFRHCPDLFADDDLRWWRKISFTFYHYLRSGNHSLLFREKREFGESFHQA
jgi:hypothetical protein